MLSIPALIKILVVFVLVVIAASFHVHLGLAAAIGGILIALWQSLSLGTIASAASAELMNPDLILLVILLASIMAFSSAMKVSGAMDVLCATIAEFAPSKRIALAIVPFIIGTLPMPGGAIISAPLVSSMNGDDKRSPETLSAVNYWFRHVLELIWPLFPAFILTTALTELKVPTLMALNLYAPISIFILGMIFILPKKDEPVLPHEEAKPKIKPKFRVVLRGIAPLGIVLGTYIILYFLWEMLSPALRLREDVRSLIGRYVPILLGLLVGSIYLKRISTKEKIFKNCIKKSTFELIGVIIGIRVFSALMNAANLAQAASLELAHAGIPAIIVIALLPFISGIVTGVGLGYVGLSMPIVLGIIASSGTPFTTGVVIAMAFGYAGMMVSPLHVCMVVTVDHFNSSLMRIIRKCALPLACFLAIACAYGALLMVI